MQFRNKWQRCGAGSEVIQEGVIHSPGLWTLKRRLPCRALKESQAEREIGQRGNKCGKGWGREPAPIVPGAIHIV